MCASPESVAPTGPSSGDSDRLRIGLVVPGFSENERDWCIPALLNLVRRLAAEHDVAVYTLRYPYREARYEVYGARVQAFGAATARGWQRLPLLWRAIAAIARDDARQPFSILHGLWADEAGFVAAAAGRRSATPVLVSLMGGELVRLPQIGYGGQLSRSGRLLTRLSLKLADGVSAGSHALSERAAAYVPAPRRHCLPLGVDLSLFKPASVKASPADLRIVHVASLAAVKDQATLLHAFALARERLAPRPLSLHIAGDGPLRGALAGQVRRLDIADHVHFYGAVAHDRLPDFYHQGDLFALSSRYESQCMALLEAAACGLPAAGTAVGLLPQLLPAPCLAPPGDAAALAHCMVRLLQDADLRAEESRRLQARVHSEYGLEVTTSRLLAVYRRLAAAS